MQSLPAALVSNGHVMNNILMVPAIFIRMAYLTPAIEQCETYGHDLDTGAAVTEEEYKAINPDGKAFIKGNGLYSAT